MLCAASFLAGLPPMQLPFFRPPSVTLCLPRSCTGAFEIDPNLEWGVHDPLEFVSAPMSAQRPCSAVPLLVLVTVRPSLTPHHEHINQPQARCRPAPLSVLTHGAPHITLLQAGTFELDPPIEDACSEPALTFTNPVWDAACSTSPGAVVLLQASYQGLLMTSVSGQAGPKGCCPPFVDQCLLAEVHRSDSLCRSGAKQLTCSLPAPLMTLCVSFASSPLL